MNRTGPVLAALLAILAICSMLLALDRPRKSVSQTRPLLVHAAAGLQAPITELAETFERETDIPVRLNFGGSGALLPQIQLGGGDLYIPADPDFLQPITNTVKGQTQIARLRPAIIVRTGNPKAIRSLDDLSRPGLRLSVADPSAAIGRFIRDHLAQTGHWSALAPNIVVTKPTVNNVIEDVALGAADATIAWAAVAARFPDVDTLPTPLPGTPTRPVIAARLSSAPQAKAFQAFLTSKGAMEIFNHHGFH